MLRMTGSGMQVNGVTRAGVQAPAIKPLPWAATGRLGVEALVEWAFFDQRVGAAAAGLNALEAQAAGLTWQNRSTCGCARAETIGQIGRQVDVSATPLRGDVHPVAEAVMAAIEASEDRALLIDWARTGARPGGWSVPARWVEPVNGWVEGERFQRAAPIYDLVGGAAGGQRRALPIQLRDPAKAVAEVAARRAMYAAWWQAVDALAFALSLRNLGFVVTGPVSPQEPWADQPVLAAVSGVGQADGVVLWVARWDALSVAMEAALGEIEGGLVQVRDVEDAPDTAIALGVRAVPHAMVVKDGKAVSNTVGFQNAKALRRWLERAAAMGA